MVGSSTSWRAVNNNVGDRMFDGSLTHMFTARRKIRRRTQILNRELRQLSSINSYEKYVKIKSAVSQVAPDDEDTDEDYFSNNDFDDPHKFTESANYCINYDNGRMCDEYVDGDEMELCETEDDEKRSGQCSNGAVESQFNTDEEVENDGESFISDIEHSPITEDVEHNFRGDSDRLSDNDADIAAVPGDSGIDEDSLDSLLINTNQIHGVKNQKQFIEKSDDRILLSPQKSHPKITCTEIVTSKYRILRDNGNKQTITNTDEKSLKKSIDENADNCFEEMSLSNIEASEGNECKRKSTTLTIPSEIDSLKYILTNLRIHNRYENDFYTDNYYHDTTKANEPDACQTDDSELSRPMDLADLIENDDLIELDTGSTLTFGDITEDDEIFLIEIPKSIIDNRVLNGKRMKIKKKSVLIDDTKYQAYRKRNDDLSCILKRKTNDTCYEIGTIEPKASIVIRQEPSQQNSDTLAFISNLDDDKNQYAPFPKNLKRRNPLVLQSDRHYDNMNNENDKAVNQILSPKRKVGKSI